MNGVDRVLEVDRHENIHGHVVGRRDELDSRAVVDQLEQQCALFARDCDEASPAQFVLVTD